ILAGLVYLTKEGLKYSSLTCSNILIHLYRDVKIRSSGTSQYLKALSSIVLELMNRYVKGDRAVSVDNLYCWPPSSTAVSFLSKTTSTALVFKLIKVYWRLISSSII
ncbi:hypothetical protein P154DRAFT_427916, partial [Amniculicola lignicola CBS 123094]